MTQLPCLCLVALSTAAVGLHTKNIRGAGNQSLLSGLHGAQPESPEVAQDTLEAEQEMMQPDLDAEMRSEEQINMTENDMDMLTDRTGNDLYDLPDSLSDITMADEPNPSAKGKTFLTADRIQKLMAQAQANVKADKNLVTEASPGLFMGYSKNRDLVIKTEQYQNMSRPIVDANGSYRIIETPYEPFAGRDPNALQKDLRAIAERKAAEQKAAEKKAAKEKAAKEKVNQTETATDDEWEAADDAEKETGDDAQEVSKDEKEENQEKEEDEEAEENTKEATAKDKDAPEKEAQTETDTDDKEDAAGDAEKDTADDVQEASEEEMKSTKEAAEEEDAPETEAADENESEREAETEDEEE